HRDKEYTGARTPKQKTSRRDNNHPHHRTAKNYYLFPLKNPNLLSQWLKEVRRKNFVPSKYSIICSEHFIDTDYQIRPGATVKLLNTNAVPSVFSGFPTHLLKPLPVKCRLLQRNCTNNIHYVPTPNAGTSVCDESSVETKVEEVIDSSEKNLNEDKSIQCTLESPTKHNLRKNVKILQQKLKRRDVKIKTLKSLLVSIRSKVPSSDEFTSILEENFGGFSLSLLLHERKCNITGKNGIRHSDTMKEFAKTLYFSSPKAFAYCRKLFTLPHPSTIRSWISSFQCEPGLLNEVFIFLKLEIQKKNCLKNCCLVFDSMSIRKQLVWEPNKGKYSGYVEFGVTDGPDSPDLASEVLVFMLVSLTKRFKCPIAFFYVNKINSSILSSLLSSAVKKLHEIGIKIWSVTCDGASSILVDRLFDILNSRIPFSKGFKSPINSGNINSIKAIFDETTSYFKSLKIQEVPIILGGRKIFVLGFIITMERSFRAFFGCIRARGDSNNNPNAVQFKNTLRQLLFTKNITVESGNCLNFDYSEGDVIEFRSEKSSVSDTNKTPDDNELEKYLIHLDNAYLGYYVKDILDYICGY
ncbi:THAP domain-containing protein 1-like, partial [Aphis craccivora]